MGDRATGEPSVDEVAGRVHSAAVHLLRAVRRVDTETGLSPARLSALSVLVFAGPRTVGELAVTEGVRSPTMSRLVAGLEVDGLVTRVASAVDRRSSTVAVTEAGRVVLLEGQRRRVALLAERLAGWEPADVALLDRAARLLEALAHDDEGA